MDKFIVTITGFGLIAFVYWFFFGKKDEATDAQTDFTVTVNGGYQPSVLTFPKDKPVKITFTRIDRNSCLEEVIFPDYRIKKYLPLNEPVTLTLPPPHTSGGFHCSMNMFHGKIVVKT